MKDTSADRPRLIERAFPLKQASLDSVHEKNVRHGHISTLHIWPARRPLAACRAALIATLLPDPGTPEKRKELCEKIGGKVVKKIERKKMPNGQVVEREKEETEGGILHWKRETENAKDLEWFREKIRKAYGDRAPRVLDPFAGGGAIPLEAMRLGCEVTAVDINPVAWFILKCTLEYPQKLAGKTHPLPEFILQDEEFMEAFYKAHPHLAGRTKHTKKQKEEFSQDLFLKDKKDSDRAPKADLAWHVRAWGKWVLNRARRGLASFYPTYADFEPLAPGKAYEKQPMRLVPLKDDGRADTDALNADFSDKYLADRKNPRWVAKPTVAYLWARTVTCKNCRATVPLLKTRWLCKKDKKRVLLTMEPLPAAPKDSTAQARNADKTGVVFGIEDGVPVKGGNAAQRREHDKRLGAGTMSGSGARCICCGTINTTEDIQQAGITRRLGEQLIALVLERFGHKEFRVAESQDVQAYESAAAALQTIAAQDTLGRLVEKIDSRRPSPNARGLSGLTRYGITTFDQVFNHRQQCSLYVLTSLVRDLPPLQEKHDLDLTWQSAIADFLALSIDKVCDYNSSFCTWHINRQTIGHTFARYALPMTSDYAESNAIGLVTGGFHSAVAWTALALEHLLRAPSGRARVQFASATAPVVDQVDMILTDPPYYDSIPYADISDFFYIWLRRTVGKRYPSEFSSDVVDRSQEIIQHAGRLDGDNAGAKRHYEAGMSKAFSVCAGQLVDEGRLVVVFAHKQPDAWETLASSIIEAGFTVDASWPIQTEMPNKTAGGARLASSVWLVCKKRPATARPGWDNRVLEEMRANIGTRLREFWDAGIRGPDFVWAATGPALEAYSKHPVVKKANDPGKIVEVGEFLSHVRRMVVDFVVGRVLSTGNARPHPGPLPEGEGEIDLAAADRMDAPTAYYLLHRHDFGLDEAPSGACILYATACGLSDRDLESTWDMLIRTGATSGKQDEDEEDQESDPDAEADPDSASDSGSKVKLKTWAQRKHKSMGYEAPGGQPVPLIDRIHRLMHLWRAGDALKVDEYLDDHGLRRQELFKRLLQSLIELSPHGSEERSLLESLSNHVGARGAVKDDGQRELALRSEAP